MTQSPLSVFTDHSQENSLSFSSRFCKFECNTHSDWLNRMVVFHLNLQILEKNTENKTKSVLKNGWCIRAQNSASRIHQPFSRKFFVIFSRIL